MKIEKGFEPEHSVVYIEIDGVYYEYYGSELDPLEAARELADTYREMAKKIEAAIEKEVK